MLIYFISIILHMVHTAKINTLTLSTKISKNLSLAVY